jgi:hypothetical protein
MIYIGPIPYDEVESDGSRIRQKVSRNRCEPLSQPLVYRRQNRFNRRSMGTILTIYTVFITLYVQDLLQQRIQDLMMRVELRLVVIDSVAALFRYEYRKEEALERAKSMFNHAHQLKFLSDHYKVGVIVVNQVSDYFYEHMGDSFSLNSLSNEKKVIPALGLSWSNCVNMRILLKKTNRMYRSEAIDMDNNNATDNEADDEEGPKKKKRKITPSVTEAALRTMTIILSSYLPNSSINFFVDSAGLKGIEEPIN